MGFWRMKSVLPPVLELKRLRIAKKHNRLAATVWSIVLGPALLFILSGLRGHHLARSQVVVALLIVGAAEVLLGSFSTTRKCAGNWALCARTVISFFTIPGVSSI
jgi:hypothetical protein